LTASCLIAKRASMLPLAHSSPRSAIELADALTRGLETHGAAATVICEGEWPELRKLRLDFTRIAQPKRIARSGAKETLRIAEVEIEGHPLMIEDIPVELSARLDGARAGIENEQLVLLGAMEGAVHLSANRTDIENGLRMVLTRLAQARGAAIKDVQLEVRTPTEHTLEFSVRVTAKVFIATTTLTVRGGVAIDDSLTAHVVKLTAEGEGMMASLAQGFLAPHLGTWQDRRIPLTDFSAAGMRVRSLRVTAGDTIRLDAELAG